MFLKVCTIAAAVGGALIFVYATFGESLLALIFRRFATGHKTELVLVSVAALFDYLKVCQGVSLTSMREFKVQTPLTAASLVVSFTLAIWL
ncbi:hypothetical protein ABTM19_19935, partial [Acinetobacter baumannii]